MQLEEIAGRNRATSQMQRVLFFFHTESSPPFSHPLRQRKSLYIQGEKLIEIIEASLNPCSINVKNLLEPMKFFLRERLLQSYMLVD